MSCPKQAGLVQPDFIDLGRMLLISLLSFGSFSHLSLACFLSKIQLDVIFLGQISDLIPIESIFIDFIYLCIWIIKIMKTFHNYCYS